MRSWSLHHWSLTVPGLTKWKFRVQQQHGVLNGPVPPARRSRLTLHKYPRPRFARGGPRRKHRRAGAERLQSGRDGEGGGSLPISIPRDPREDPPTDPVCRWVLEPRNNNWLLSWRTQASETRALPPPLVRDRCPRAGSESPRLPQLTQTRPAPGAASDLPQLLAPLSRPQASAPLPRGPGPALPRARTRASTAEKPRALGPLQATETRT